MVAEPLGRFEHDVTNRGLLLVRVVRLGLGPASIFPPSPGHSALLLTL